MTGVQTCALPICFPVTIWGGYYKKFGDLYLEMIKDESFTKECFLYNSLLMLKTIQSFIAENGIETERQNELLKKMDIGF